MENIKLSYKVIESEINDQGAYTHQIKWVIPIEFDKSGYIVQRVEIEDPCKLLPNYVKPYFEAWRIIDGKIYYDDNSPIEHDDSFSNCCDDMKTIFCEIAIENTQRKMRENEVNSTYVLYKCIVYWVDDADDCASKIHEWKKGNENNITMAGNLKASYEKPGELVKCFDRVFRAEFKL